jgi:hypothetical protein
LRRQRTDGWVFGPQITQIAQIKEQKILYCWHAMN